MRFLLFIIPGHSKEWPYPDLAVMFEFFRKIRSRQSKPKGYGDRRLRIEYPTLLALDQWS